MDRRRAPRFAHPGLVSWNRLDDAWQHHGWIADESRAGISFVTPYAKRLLPGETIVVRTGRGSGHDTPTPLRCFRVQRVEPYDNHLRLVACTAQRP